MKRRGGEFLTHEYAPLPDSRRLPQIDDITALLIDLRYIFRGYERNEKLLLVK